MLNLFSQRYQYAPVAQLDRVRGYEPRGREFESLRARHKNNSLSVFAKVRAATSPPIWSSKTPLRVVVFVARQH